VQPVINFMSQISIYFFKSGWSKAYDGTISWNGKDLNHFTQHNLYKDETIIISSIIDDLSPS